METSGFAISFATCHLGNRSVYVLYMYMQKMQWSSQQPD